MNLISEGSRTKPWNRAAITFPGPTCLALIYSEPRPASPELRRILTGLRPSPAIPTC